MSLQALKFKIVLRYKNTKFKQCKIRPNSSLLERLHLAQREGKTHRAYLKTKTIRQNAC